MVSLFNRIRPKLQSLWATGFRPFFLLGNAFAIVIMLIWLKNQAFPSSNAGYTLYWHAHEMIFGFIAAIIIGFLYTASQNWTQRRGVHGRPLIIAIMLWVAGRLVFNIPTAPAVRLIDLIFIPYASGLLFPYLSHRDQRHNVIYLIYLGILALCNLAFHLDSLGLISDIKRPILYFAIHATLVMLVIFTIRIVPFFSKNALTDYQVRKSSFLDRMIPLMMMGYSISYLVPQLSLLTSIISLILATSLGYRFYLWYDHRIWNKPILAILYVGFIWLIFGFSLSIFAPLGWVSQIAVMHAFSAGSICTFLVGMTSRVTLGHTGRVIRASRIMVAAYLSMFFAGFIRVMGAVFGTAYYQSTILTSGTFWILSLTFLFYEIAPILVQPRIDGKPG